LIDAKEWKVLTDPVLAQYCSPVPIRGLRRRSPPAIGLKDLPKLNAVLISHNHYDHLDARAVKAIHRLNPDILWVLPMGLKRWFSRRGIERCVELQWGQSHIEDGHKVTAVPAQHFSGRTLWDKGRTLWNGYVLESAGKTLYFAGDTGYNPIDFKEIGRHFSKIDLSLIPIGSYSPRQFMSPVHCNPADGVQIHLDVKSTLSLGMHWNTFHLSDEPFDQPPYDLYLAMKEKNLPFDTFLPQEMGVYVNW
jgi:N-acyl-phosphatidylethanolamine-hydrolysing phospholipase D